MILEDQLRAERIFGKLLRCMKLAFVELKCFYER